MSYFVKKKKNLLYFDITCSFKIPIWVLGLNILDTLCQTVHKHSQKQIRSVLKCEWDIKNSKLNYILCAYFIKMGRVIADVWQ